MGAITLSHADFTTGFVFGFAVQDTLSLMVFFGLSKSQAVFGGEILDCEDTAFQVEALGVRSTGGSFPPVFQVATDDLPAVNRGVPTFEAITFSASFLVIACTAFLTAFCSAWDIFFPFDKSAFIACFANQYFSRAYPTT